MKGWHRMAWGAAIILAVILLVGEGLAQSAARRGGEEWPDPGFLAPAFALRDLNGRQVLRRSGRGESL